jgi:hypothetical protein
MPLTVDEELLAEVESRLHSLGEDGWDSVPFFFSIIEVVDADGEPAFGLGQLVCPPEAHAAYPDPVDLMAAMCDRLGEMESTAVVQASERVDSRSSWEYPFVGVMAIIETWGVTMREYATAVAAMSQEYRDQVRELYGKIPMNVAIPGAREARNVFAMTPDYQVHVLQRLRADESLTYYPPMPDRKVHEDISPNALVLEGLKKFVDSYQAAMEKVRNR